MSARLSEWDGGRVPPLCRGDCGKDFAVGHMADRRGLRLVGFAYGGVVAIVALIALVVVTSHVNMTVEARPDSAIASAR
jgi:hypothetical protein